MELTKSDYSSNGSEDCVKRRRPVSSSTELLTDKNIKASQEVLHFAAVKLNDGIPFYIQLFADSLSYLLGDNIEIKKMVEIETIYQKVTDKQHKEFIDLHTRLKEYLSKIEFKAATRMLAHLAFEPMDFEDLYPYVEQIILGKTEVNRLLKRLVDECYLKKEGGVYRFVSPMLADWWKNSYEWER